MTSRSKWAIWVLLVFALVLTSAMGAITISIGETYLQNHSYFFDCVYYSFCNARLVTCLADEGVLGLAVEEWLNNARHPLRTL